MNDGYSGGFGIGDRASLDAPGGIHGRVVVGYCGCRISRQSRDGAFLVHHLEHLGHSRAFAINGGIAQKVAPALVIFAKINDAGGRSAETQLVFYAAAVNIVEFTFFARLHLASIWERQTVIFPLCPARFLQSGQRQVNDIFCNVLIAAGDEAFGADNIINPRLIGGESLGDDITDIGAAVGFRQVHRACPLTGKHFGQKIYS